MPTVDIAATSGKPAGLVVLASDAFERIYGEEHLAALGQRVRLLAPPLTPEQLEAWQPAWSEAEVLFSGWGAPVLTKALLDRLPRLKAVFYGAGSIRYFATDEMWRRGIRVTTSASVNGEAVANYTVGAVLFALKQGFRLSRFVREAKAFAPGRPEVPGAAGGKVALISFGEVARSVCRLLQPFGVRVMVYDPFVTPEQAKVGGVELVSLERAFAEADVVSLHAPLLEETRGLVGGALLRSMRRDATFINTARGAVVRENEMIEVLRSRDDITAILDVTDPEPPLADSPLYVLPNVILTPHSAGAMDRECRQLGAFMVAEFDRWLKDGSLRGEVTAQMAANRA